LGYDAYVELQAPSFDEITEHHLAVLIEREKDPILSQTKTLDEVFASLPIRSKR
jgi:hypothetical protein